MKLLGGAMQSNGNSVEKNNKNWRTRKPTPKKFINCEHVTNYCPDNAFYKDGDKQIIDYDYCKGCGICANLPLSPIKMEKE